MRNETQPEDARAQVIAGYRVVRRVATGDRAVLYLAAGAGGAGDDPPRLVMLRVYPADTDAERLAIDVEAMSGDAASVLPRLLDVATLADGQVCLVVERVGGPSLATLLRDRTLSAGEAVTVLAPIAAELARLERRGFAPMRLNASDIVFDGTGRPRFIASGALARIAGDGVGAGLRVERVRASHTCFAGLVGEIAQASRPSAPIDRVRALVESRLAARPFVADAQAYERALFEAAPPSPVAGRWDGNVVRRSVVPPPSAALLRPAVAPVGDVEAGRAAPLSAESDRRPRRRRRALGRLTADLLAIPPADEPRPDEPRNARREGTSHPLRARVRAAIHRRRAPLTFGVLVGGAALVLVLTVVSPGTGLETPAAGVAGAGSPEAAHEVAGGEPVAPESNSPGTTGAEAESGAPVRGDDPAVAVAELLRRRAGCLADLDPGCVEAVAQPGSALATADRDAVLAAREGGAVEVEPFDLEGIVVTGSLGEAWLVQVPFADGREPASVLAMSTEAGWRLREIFD